MKVKYGNGSTEYGPGIDITLTGDEVACAIMAYLVARDVYVGGSRSITVNGDYCQSGRVYVDPSGAVVRKGQYFSGRGPAKSKESPANGAEHTEPAISAECNDCPHAILDWTANRLVCPFDECRQKQQAGAQ